ncbi:MAG: CoA transferase [Nocardioides sp.]|uniref:CaiB/BaiF CoA transferase family protein n=1 Tax=Nocardioides sp. TaxID=35761 RepID=UPI0039E4979D
MSERQQAIAGTDLPLDGIRVVDLTVVWSGPGATALLGDLGAEVIRVEGNDRLSRQVSARTTKESIAATGYHGGTYPDRDPGERPYDRFAVFNWHARNKLSACMNLDTPEGHQALLDLVRVSDVLVENNSNGVLEKLGIGHERLLEINPRLIVARMPPLGMSGPISDYLGYGPNFNSLIGIAAMDGYEGEEPDSAGENYHMDEAAPAGLGFSVIAALWDRERTGRGGLIEFAQAENVMAEVGEFVLDWQVNGRDPAILGNSDPHLLQDVFAAAGEDRWVAVSVRDDRDWRALLEATGLRPELATLGSSAQDRHEHSGEIRAALARWCVERTPETIVGLLAEVRIPVGEVLDEPALLADPHLTARGWFRERTHPSVGTHRYPGHPWRTDDFELAFGRPTPGFGEDNDYVYLTVLGYDRSTYDDLVARGLVTDHQIA